VHPVSLLSNEPCSLSFIRALASFQSVMNFEGYISRPSRSQSSYHHPPEPDRYPPFFPSMPGYKQSRRLSKVWPVFISQTFLHFYEFWFFSYSLFPRLDGRILAFIYSSLAENYLLFVSRLLLRNIYDANVHFPLPPLLLMVPMFFYFSVSSFALFRSPWNLFL